VGFDFWEAMVGFLHVLERALSYDAVLALGLDGAALRRLVDGPGTADGPALDGRASPAIQRATWGDWYDRERELYIASAARVERLGWDQIQAIGGPEVEAHGRLIREAFERLVWARTPERLRLVPLGSVEIGRETTAIVSHRAYDPLLVPSALLPHLARFDGRPTEGVRAELEAAGVPLAAGMLQRLVDWGVLVAG
jgi:hypothetical protein